MEKNTFKIRNEANVCIIDIEGVIGVPEYWQFETEDDRVATYEKFRSLISKDATQVVVNIRSTGGDVNDALLIYDALKELSVPIQTRCYGYTASAATVIAQAGSEGQRYISENALYLIHKSSFAVEGNADEVEAKLSILRATDERLSNLYASRGNEDSNFYSQLMGENNGAGKWLTPQETIESGLADSIITHEPNKVNNMSEIKIKESLLNRILAKCGFKTMAEAEAQYAPVITKEGSELSFDGDIVEGATASLDGTHTLEDGRVVEVLDGKITKVTAPEDPKQTEIDALESEKQQLEQERDSLQAEKQQLEGEVQAKVAEIAELTKNVKTESDIAILERVQALGGIDSLPASEYKPKTSPKTQNKGGALSPMEQKLQEARERNKK